VTKMPQLSTGRR